MAFFSDSVFNKGELFCFQDVKAYQGLLFYAFYTKDFWFDFKQYELWLI